MKKKIPFDLFEPGQTIYFDNRRLVDFEETIGRSLAAEKFLSDAQLNLKETVFGLMYGLQHHYPKANFDFYCEKLDEYYMKSGNGFPIVSDFVLRAIMATGVYGKKFDEIANGEETEEIKNV